MLLAQRVGHRFREVIRRRGSSYARAGRVAIRAADTERAAAIVLGSSGSRYHVEIEATEKPSGRISLGAACTCPHFDRGEACKHIFATICELDDQGWQPAALERVSRRAVEVELVDDDDLGGSEWLDDDDGESDENDVHADARGGALGDAHRERQPAVRGRARGSRPDARWRARLSRLAAPETSVPGLPVAARAHRDPRVTTLAGVAAPLLYLIDPEAVMREQVLRIYFARRAVLKGGGLGALRAARLARNDHESAPASDERHVLAQLLALAQADETARRLSYGWYPNAAGSAESVAIPSALMDPLLPRLATTGRLALLPGWVAGQRRPQRASPRAEAVPPAPCWLALDDAPAWQLRLELTRSKTHVELRGRYVRGEEILALDGTTLVLAGGFLVREHVLSRADVGGTVRALAELRRGPLQIPAGELDLAIERLAALPGVPPLDIAEDLGWSEGAAAPAPRLRFTGLDGGGRDVYASLGFGYGAAWIGAGSSQERVADREARRLLARDPEAETGALGALLELGFRAAGAQGAARAGGAIPPGALVIERSRFEISAEHLLAKGWIVEADGRRLRRAGASRASVRSGMDFFDLEGAVDFEGESVPFPALLAAAREGSRFVRLSSGARGLLPHAWLERCAGIAGVAEPNGDALRFTRAQLGFVDALLCAQDEARSDERFDELRARTSAFEGIRESDAPPGFHGVLRDYQREGLAWLRFLRSFGIGGCLADDMGLGKTVQVLALLALRESQGGAGAGADAPSGPVLIVAPKSVVHGWLAEAERFTPGLVTLRYTGPERIALRQDVARADLVVTTYGILRRDAAWLREQHFDTVVLDEAQAIKNEGSRTARAASELRAGHRLALTGTPVENHLGELASLLGFLNPGFLGRARGLEALSSSTDHPASREVLARALRPILLRRTKEQVLRELPPRTEQTLRCELAPAQRRHYEELRRYYQASIARRVETHGIARAKIHVLEGLLRLRQAACHPALLDPKRAAERSAKLDTLFEQLDEVLAEGHKALVFSQFTRFLALVRTRLAERGIEHAYLDGRTRDRKACVARFQEDPTCRVFAISLRAGGTGLNLTAADYVFLLDPWWNPAVEAQAIDRAHRIGQTRPVLAYRLVAENTVEEKILALQAHKRELARSIFADERSLVSSLTAEDLRALFG